MDERSGFSDDDGTGKKRSGKERVEYSLFGDHQGSAIRTVSLHLFYYSKLAETIAMSTAIPFSQMLHPLRRILRMISRQRKVRRLETTKMKWQISLWRKMRLMAMAKL